MCHLHHQKDGNEIKTKGVCSSWGLEAARLGPVQKRPPPSSILGTQPAVTPVCDVGQTLQPEGVSSTKKPHGRSPHPSGTVKPKPVMKCTNQIPLEDASNTPTAYLGDTNGANLLLVGWQGPKLPSLKPFLPFFLFLFQPKMAKPASPAAATTTQLFSGLKSRSTRRDLLSQAPYKRVGPAPFTRRTRHFLPPHSLARRSPNSCVSPPG